MDIVLSGFLVVIEVRICVDPVEGFGNMFYDAIFPGLLYILNDRWVPAASLSVLSLPDFFNP